MKLRLEGLALGALLLGSCSAPPEAGVRYRAERELWQANREARRLGIQPKLVSKDEWRALASRFEGIAVAYGTMPVHKDSSAAGRAATEVRQLAARSLISAAEVHAILGDSTRMMHNYERVASDFKDLPLMQGEVALVQGRMAESKGQWDDASAAYQIVVDQVPPDPGGAGVPTAVLDLPLRIARLQTRAAGLKPAAAGAFYDAARDHYQTWIDANRGTLIEVDSRRRLADVAADRGDWNTAITSLRELETQLRTSLMPGRDPGSVRFDIAVLQTQTEPAGDASRKTLTALLADYPKSPAAPQALLILAADSSQRGQVDEALAYLDRVRKDYADVPDVVAQSLMARGRVLEQHGRWAEARETFRALPLDQPTSDAALQAPLEIASHYARLKDEAGLNNALADAEKHYRDFVARYPAGKPSLSAHVKLAQTLALQKRYVEAITELLEIGESFDGAPEGASYFVDAARMALNQLEDKARTAQILDRLGKLYPDARVGQWAVAEGTRLREGSIP